MLPGGYQVRAAIILPVERYGILLLSLARLSCCCAPRPRHFVKEYIIAVTLPPGYGSLVWSDEWWYCRYEPVTTEITRQVGNYAVAVLLPAWFGVGHQTLALLPGLAMALVAAC